MGTDISEILVGHVKIWFRVRCPSVETGGIDFSFRISDLAALVGRDPAPQPPNQNTLDAPKLPENDLLVKAYML